MLIRLQCSDCPATYEGSLESLDRLHISCRLRGRWVRAEARHQLLHRRIARARIGLMGVELGSGSDLVELLGDLEREIDRLRVTLAGKAAALESYGYAGAYDDVELTP